MTAATRSEPSSAPARAFPDYLFAGLFLEPPKLPRYRHVGLTALDVPPMGDPRWRDWTRGLSAFIASEPRTWADLAAWASLVRLKEELLRQMLAALEELDEAFTVGADETLTWRHKPAHD